MRKMILLRGCSGKMGRIVSELLSGREDAEVVAGVDIVADPCLGYPVYSSLDDFDGDADVVVDFSFPDGLDELLEYCARRKFPLLAAATGYSSKQEAAIARVAEGIPIFRSENLSVGISVLAKLAAFAASTLGEGYNVEIIERHHKRKLDAPSGTAKLLYKTVQAALPYQPEPVYDRQKRREKRPEHEIGIHSIRGGTIVGDHDVIFAGTGEVITISHSAESREVFAAGAIRAALFLAGKPAPGMYGMKDIL